MASSKKPNILVIWGDDIGISNLSCYSNGRMGAIAGKWAATFKDFPPIQKPNTFTLDEALTSMSAAAAGG